MVKIKKQYFVQFYSANIKIVQSWLKLKNNRHGSKH